MEKKKHTLYYEAIIQLRNPNEDILSFVRKELKSKGVSIAKEKKLKNGIDLYVASQRFARRLGVALQQRFTGVLLTSRKLHTVSKKTGKRLYRVTVMFRYVPIKPGSRIEYKGTKLVVLQVQKNTLLAKESSGKKHRIRIKDLVARGRF